MSKKEIREYKEKYGEIPNNIYDRFVYIVQELKLKVKEVEKIKEAILRLKRARWVELDFIFYFLPKATPRARYSGRTKVFYVKNASDNSQIFKDFIENSDDEYDLIVTPCKFYCDLYMPMPAQMSKIEKILAELKLLVAIPKPDWDNAGKTYSDMIQKHLLLDDCLIVDGAVRKFYSFKPRIEIHLEYMEKFDCKYNKKKVEGWKYYQENLDKITEKDSIV